VQLRRAVGVFNFMYGEGIWVLNKKAEIRACIYSENFPSDASMLIAMLAKI
jgi:hypothetical protein